MVEAWRWTSNPAVQQSRIVTHTGVSFASISLPPHPLLLIFEQANQVQPNLSSWQDTSVRTSSGPPQSTNSIAVHVAPVITLQRRYYEYRPRTFSVRTNQRFLYTLPSSLLFFPFRFQGWKKRWVGGWVAELRRFERKKERKRSFRGKRSRYERALIFCWPQGMNRAHFRFKLGIYRETCGEESRFLAGRVVRIEIESISYFIKLYLCS